MLADLALIIWENRWLIGWLGLQSFVGGFALLVFHRAEVTMGPDPVVPAVDAEPTVAIALPPKAHAARDDADTHVLPAIQGALPPRTGGTLTNPIFVLDDGPPALVLPPRNEERTETVSVEHLTRPYVALQGETIPGLRVIPSVGELWPEEQKSAPTEVTQVVDLCPLTTHELEVPQIEATPLFRETFGRHPSAELHTTDLTVSLDQIAQRERVA